MMEISSLPISASHRSKLLSAGYTTLSSLSAVSPLQLSRDLNVALQEAVDILKVSSESCRVEVQDGDVEFCKGAQTAWDMLSEEQALRHISTGSGDLDSIFGGGIHCKEVTEIGGVPGIGKTQLGIQLAINVQIPYDFGGLGGKAIYIDTEGSFMAERAYQIAEASIWDTFDNFGCQPKEIPEKLKPESFLANIFYFRICSYTEQIALINYLEQFLVEHKDVKIVIIDSVTFHFRQDFDDLAIRTRVLGGMSLKLMNLAKKFSLSVVLMNQVTTKFTEGSFHLTLALGDSWSHSCTNRVILYWNGNDRHAYLDKSPYLRPASVHFSVTGKGIRDATSQCKRVRMM
ncbi:LOW QUALITY PROTEIN: DNA repair protein RAD51 homolog 3-like [Dioscorea cayenensis subsp. rotundata]|uniref:DNA repair protein RAD51 homolog 3 n=1 Tax=Dioscorea cayennensis subsp. rotundata TaxID=55577 RepID=A0AB40BPJ4_DIOCR|nr:LOW QUALITY PROTEIN: DNA repair protein RAD51 homolog 3-like [Dioscorea cayenensis subsp. rotundata]